MHKFQEGQKACVMKAGAEIEMVVFHQSGELVYLFDRANRYYLFDIREVQPVKTPQSRMSMCDAFSEATVHEPSWKRYIICRIPVFERADGGAI